MPLGNKKILLLRHTLTSFQGEDTLNLYSLGGCKIPERRILLVNMYSQYKTIGGWNVIYVFIFVKFFELELTCFTILG